MTDTICQKHLLNIHIYPSIFANESRILKITRSLKREAIFSRILVVAVWKEGLPRHESLEDGIDVIRIGSVFGKGHGGMLGQYVNALGWCVGVLIALRSMRVACINCHSLGVLPLSVFIKLWKACVLIYDTHELETEVKGLSGISQQIARIVESCLIKMTDAICVVNLSIADWYVNQYRLKQICVVRNVPNFSEVVPARTGLLRRALGVPANLQLFLYQGLLCPGRGVDLLIDAFSAMPNHHLVFMGYGPLEKRIREAAAHHANIHFMPAVAPDSINDYTVDADIGIALIENDCLSYYLCLPNKLFEYSICGVPAIVSNFPEMSRFVDEYNCGWKILPSVIALQRLVQQLSASEISAKRANARCSCRTHCWQKEEKLLLAMYEQLGFSSLSPRVDTYSILNH